MPKNISKPFTGTMRCLFDSIYLIYTVLQVELK